MILADLVKDISYGNSKKASKYEEEILTQVQAFEETTKQFLELVKTHGDRDSIRAVNSTVEDLVEKFNNSLIENRKNTDFLDMKVSKAIKSIEFSSYGGPSFHHRIYNPAIHNAPRTKMENIIEVAEKLGLLIIPSQYVNLELIENDRYDDGSGYSRRVSMLFNNFVNHVHGNHMNAWLVCPIQYYDIQAHATDLTYEFFVPSAVRQAFTSIKIILPMLIGMINQIESLSKKVDNMSTELNTIRQTLVQQQQQIDRLQEELTQQRIKIAEQAARERQMEQELQQARAQIQWEIFDPMLIALPDNVTNINSYTGNVALGPAWGPEIDKVLIDLLGLTQQADRKDYISTEAGRYN